MLSYAGQSFLSTSVSVSITLCANRLLQHGMKDLSLLAIMSRT